MNNRNFKLNTTSFTLTQKREEKKHLSINLTIYVPSLFKKKKKH